MREKVDHRIVYDLDISELVNYEYISINFSNTKFINLPGALYIISLLGYVKSKKNNEHHFHSDIVGISDNIIHYLISIGFFEEMKAKCGLLRINNDDLLLNKIIALEKNNKLIANNVFATNQSVIMPISTIHGDKEHFESDIKNFQNKFTNFYSALCQFKCFSFDDKNNNKKDYREFTIAIYEIMKNIFHHSESWGLGGIYANKEQGVLICYYDIGLGIAGSIKKYKPNIFNNDYDAIRWALHDGNSSKEGNGENQGKGFSAIEKFVTNKMGSLSIRTGYYHMISGKNEIKMNFFPGTQIVIHIPNV